MGFLDRVAGVADRIGDGLKAGYGGLYESFDTWAHGYLPGGVSREEAAETWEQGHRDLADAVGLDPNGRLPDFGTGVSRIITGTVGKGDNPTWSDAWASTDDTVFAGWAPGGSEPSGLDGIKDTLKDAAGWGVAALVGIGLLAVSRR